MPTILVVNSLPLAIAILNKKTDHPPSAAILSELSKHDATFEPFSTISGVNPLIRQFRVIVADDKRADLLRSLRKLPGVVDAYDIPPAPCA